MLKEIVQAARDKVAMGWVQGPCAIDSNGVETGAGSGEAVAWCAYGAFRAITHKYPRDEFYKAEMAVDNYVRETTDLSGMIEFNETPGRTQAEVVALFDAVIERI